jgi:perosamine synthetase
MLSLVPTEHWDYGPGDMVRGLLTAFGPGLSQGPPALGIPGLGRCLPIRSARAGIVVALKALGLPPRAVVGVPLYCCPVVFKAIEAAGCRPRFIDVDPKTYCLSVTDLAAKSSEVDAVIAVHMFGNLCDMSGLRNSAPGKPLIEDCAQALGSRFQGRVAGSFGDIAVFSFRSGKYLSAGEGGALYCDSRDLETRLSGFIGALPVPSRVNEFAHVLRTYVRSALRSRPLWGLIGTRLWGVYDAKVSYEAKSPLVIGQVYRTDLSTTVRRLGLIDLSIEKQRSNAGYYSQNLAVERAMLCAERPGAFYNRLQYPLLFSTPVECEGVAAYLLANRVSTARPYKDVPAIARTYYGYSGDCPGAERIANTVLVIPCSYGLSAADVEQIASCVNSAWARVSGVATRVPPIGPGGKHAPTPPPEADDSQLERR